MKKHLLLASAVLAIFTFPLISKADGVKDREEIKELPGTYGVLHTENYEYVCSTIDGTDKAEIKIWLDQDFTKAEPYRFAVGFANDGTFLGYKAIESKVLSYTRARCPGLCLAITIATTDGSAPVKIQFKEDSISKKITMTTSTDTKGTAPAVCKLNEVE